MVVIFGRYYFGTKARWFRKDWCRHCDKEVRAIGSRPFIMLHLYWIPFLPLGFWRRWRCVECGKTPHSPARARRPIKFLLAGFLIFMAVYLWMVDMEGAPSSAGLWASRLFFTVLALGTTLWALRPADSRPWREQFRHLGPCEDKECPSCHREITEGPDGWQCSECRIERQ